MNGAKKLIRRVTFTVAALALLIPVTVSPGQGIDGNEACAGPTCCRELLSLCSMDGKTTIDHYKDGDGKCGTTAVD